ncbi:hypothetical protein L2E82_24584 [Cichorium intybus]|uniref:Uncharacterized protein n=1 Tax=Cichorium intybus TaxID=13427 RepID=A0ACB9E140_CICIN|nr:hypothetical protein L2E82_24584 [Cichorium intybus]
MATTFNMLPEDCVSTILSLTSPADAYRLMLTSSSLRSAAESDLSFSLNKISGRKSFVLSARALSISFSEEPNHWTWTTSSASRFSEVIEVKSVSSIQIEGRIKTQDLSPNTTYGAYLIIQVSDRAFGLDSIASEISVSKDECSVSNTAYLCPLDERKQLLESLLFMNRRRMMEKLVLEGEGRRPSKREDGWMEIELGEFIVGQKSEVVQMNLMEVKGNQLKGGLIIEGIEVRPKC